MGPANSITAVRLHIGAGPSSPTPAAVAMDDHPIQDDGDDRPHPSYSDGDETAENATADKPGTGVDNSPGASKPADDENLSTENRNLSGGENPAALAENLAAASENLADKAGNMDVDGNAPAKPGNMDVDGNPPADGNLASESGNLAASKPTRNAAGANDGDANPPLEQLGRSPVISSVIFDSQCLTGGGGRSPDSYIRGDRGKLSHQNWEEVAAHVSVVYPAKTAEHCKNRMKTPKTADKLFADAGGLRLFEKLDSIDGGTDAAPQWASNIPTKARSVRNRVEKSEKLNDDLPPPEKSRCVEHESPAGSLARAMEGFTEAYEKVEKEKMKQAAEMGKQWRILMKDFEWEWIKFCKKTQEEISKLNNK